MRCRAAAWTARVDGNFDPLCGERAHSARSAAPEAAMSERVDTVPLSSFIEGERRARIKRTLVIEACLRGTLHTFSEWLRVAAERKSVVEGTEVDHGAWE